MKNPTSKRRTDPSAASLAELPEIELGPSARRNPYAARISREGIELRHDGPSARSLAELPEVTFTKRARRNPYAERLAAELHRVRVGRGRPRAGEEVGPSRVRSVRLPTAIWDALEAEAAATGLAVHAVLRAAVTSFLQARLDAMPDRHPSKASKPKR
jgi:hypothetical protein